MPLRTIHLLLVEDDDAYATMLGAELQAAAGPLDVVRVTCLGDASDAVAARTFDAILLDLELPDSSGILTIDRMHAAAPGVPLIVITSHDNEEVAIQAVQHGAEDYLVKDRADADALLRSVRYARERVRLNRTLRQREARFRALVEYSSDAIALVDARYQSLYNSRSVERVSGFTPEELSGRYLDLFAHPEDMPEINRRFEECMANPGRAVTLEYRYQHKDGTWHWGEAVAVNRLDDPAVQAIVVNHRDVTGRKVTEEALRVSEEQLRQAHKMEAVGRLAGGVAHDFNNVLTAIFGYADLLLDQFGTDDPRRSDVEEIRRSAERAATLTRQLLAFSRKQVMLPRVIDLNAVVRNLEPLLRRLVGEDITMEIAAAEDLWPVRADPGQIEQVLMNLAANARDAMPEGGRLRVESGNASLTEDSIQELPGLRPGEFAVLSVTDSGEGIPESVQRHIFEPFFTTKEQGKGTGLGLATVYGIVKQSGGGVYLSSEEGRGTRFSVYLPRVPS